MKSRHYAFVVAACIGVLGVGPLARADDNNARIVTQQRSIIVIESAFCSLPNVKEGTPCNPPCPPSGCPGHCISGQCVKQILK